MALVPSMSRRQRLYDTLVGRFGRRSRMGRDEASRRPSDICSARRKEWARRKTVSVVSISPSAISSWRATNAMRSMSATAGSMRARVEGGRLFLRKVNRFLERWFRERGYRANRSPMRNAGFRYVFEAGTNAQIADKVAQFHEQLVGAALWPTSAGWGTFFAFEGLITERPFRQCRDRRPAARHETPLHGALRPLLDIKEPVLRNCPAQATLRRQVASSVLFLFRHRTAGEVCARASAAASARSMCRAGRRIPKKDKFRFELHFVRKGFPLSGRENGMQLLKLRSARAAEGKSAETKRRTATWNRHDSANESPCRNVPAGVNRKAGASDVPPRRSVDFFGRVSPSGGPFEPVVEPDRGVRAVAVGALSDAPQRHSTRRDS